MEIPIMTKELAERLEKAEIDFFTSRINAIGEREGNPMGVEIKTFGKTTAYYIKNMPWATFNSVKGFGPEDLDMLDNIISFYKERGMACNLEIIPSKANAELMYELAKRGFYQEGFHSTLYGLPNPNPPEYPQNIVIKEIENKEEFDLYGELHCLGTGMSVEHKNYFVENNIVLFQRPGWHIFIGYVDDIPAGVGVMHISDQIASCTLSTTIPAYRNKGLQSSFLKRRIYEASLTGCKLVVAQASFASTSQNNMERAGMRIAYTRGTWRQFN